MLDDPSIDIELIGYADPVGSIDYNKKLARQRAIEVARFMVNQGIEIDRLSAYSRGEERTGRQTEEAYASSRRVEVIRR